MVAKRDSTSRDNEVVIKLMKSLSSINSLVEVIFIISFPPWENFVTLFRSFLLMVVILRSRGLIEVPRINTSSFKLQQSLAGENLTALRESYVRNAPGSSKRGISTSHDPYSHLDLTLYLINIILFHYRVFRIFFDINYCGRTIFYEYTIRIWILNKSDWFNRCLNFKISLFTHVPSFFSPEFFYTLSNICFVKETWSFNKQRQFFFFFSLNSFLHQMTFIGHAPCLQVMV